MRKITGLLTFSICTFFVGSVLAVEPQNLGTLRTELIQYHDSGAYDHQISQVYHQAENYLTTRVNQNTQSAHPKKLAVVFDIDETALSNYTDMKNLNFGGSPQMIVHNLAKAEDPAILPALQLYQEAQKDHVAVFFITGRSNDLTAATIHNLTSTGYKTWTALYLRPTKYDYPSISPYKSGARKKITSEGYDIVLNIGDQYSDLAGGYADKTFKLPNPYYFIS